MEPSRGPGFIKDTLIGGHLLQKESIMGATFILLTPAPIIDPFRTWRPSLCHKDTAKGKKCPLLGGLSALSCVFMMVLQHYDLNQSERSVSMDLDQ